MVWKLWDGLGMVWDWLGGGWELLGLVWGWFGGHWDGEIRVTIRAGLLSHWPVQGSPEDQPRIHIGDTPGERLGD